jgi:hypothetical protein
MGPSLFLYYINDIPTGLDSIIRLFADDTIVYLLIKSNSDALNLHRDLDKLAQWKQLWKMAFQWSLDQWEYRLCNRGTDLVPWPFSGALGPETDFVPLLHYVKRCNEIDW